MLILQIETATSVCSCALSLNGETIAVKEINQANVHIEKITLFIEALLKETGHAFDDLDAIAVSMGPGSYTGLRIGVSTAKGLCYALDIPLLAVNTLEAMAYGFRQKYSALSSISMICPMIDARRMEVYSAVYVENLNLIEPVAARIIDENSFNHLIEKGNLILFGDGAEKFNELFPERIEEVDVLDQSNKEVAVGEGELPKRGNVIVVNDFVNSASYLSKLAYEKALKNQYESVAYFEPFYLKDFLPTQPKKK